MIEDVRGFWNGLGDFWTSFENRKEIEYFWDGMLQAFTEASTQLHLATLSPYLGHSHAVWDEKYKSFEIIVSGAQANNLSGTTEFPLPYDMLGTFSIPTLKAMETGIVYAQTTDFTITNENRINFITMPLPSATSDKLTLYAESSKKVDPFIYNLLRKVSGFQDVYIDSTDYVPYTYKPGTVTTLEHKIHKASLLKYLSWAIYYLKKQPPTLYNLAKLYHILYGGMFAYEAGILTTMHAGSPYTTTSVKIGNYEYFPAFVDTWWLWHDGDYVEQFTPLVYNTEVYDIWGGFSSFVSIPDVQKSCTVEVYNFNYYTRYRYLQSVVDDFNKNFFDASKQLITTIEYPEP